MPRLLDLYCGAGGAAMGYHRAGFDVVGVDIAPQPNYPFEFHRIDAFEMLKGLLYLMDGSPNGWSVWDAIHASPPCQAYIRGGRQSKDHPRLIEPLRPLLEATGLPWVIENVPGAPMRPDLELCGSMFGLEVRRHRWFECSWPVSPFRAPCVHDEPIAGVYGHPHGKAGAWPGMLPSDLVTWQRAMGIDWMDADELTNAIPPAYTEYIGNQLLCHLTSPPSYAN